MASYQAHDYCGEYWASDIRLSDKYLTALLRFTGENRELVCSWMRGLAPSGNENFVLMDSTHVMSASEHLGINAKGYNGAGEYGKQVRLMYVFQAKLSRPIYYRLINGNMTDISCMSLCVKELGITQAVFIADKGLYGEQNIKALAGKNPRRRLVRCRSKVDGMGFSLPPPFYGVWGHSLVLLPCRCGAHGFPG